MPKIGNGCIFKIQTRSGKTVWKVEVPTGYDYRGKRKRVRRTAHSKSEAIALHRQMIAELVGGSLGDPKTETFRDYAEWWLDNVPAIRVKTSTLTDYRDRLRRNVYPYLGDRRIGEITTRDIEEWLAAMIRSGKARTTVNGSKQVLGAVLGHAYKQGIISRNPASLVSRLPIRSDDATQVKEPWSIDEVHKALTSAKGTEMDLFLHLGILFGLRRGEILGLRWDDFDFGAGSVTIRRTLKEERTIRPNGTSTVELTTSSPKTKSSTRKLEMGPELMSAIQRHRIYLADLRYAAGDDWIESGYVFCNTFGGPIYPSNFYRKYVKFCAENGLRHIRIHDLRHTAAVLSFEAGVRIESISQGLGHSRIDITKSVYAPSVQTLNTEFTRGLAGFLNLADGRMPDLQAREIEGAR